MTAVLYHDVIEIPHGQVLEGTMTADVYEYREPDPYTTNLIRADQDWGILVKWEIRSTFCHVMGGEWHVQALLERIGHDTPIRPDYDLPVVVVPYVTGVHDRLDHQMRWDVKVSIKKGEVAPGAYKLVTLLQLFDHDGHPTAIAGMDEQRGIINVFDPG